MRFASLAAVVAAAAVVSAQDTVVTVGLSTGAAPDTLVFTPNNIIAKNGSVITFQFAGTPGNHSVTQSSFPKPCEPLAGGFDSGNVQKLLNSTDNAMPTWNLTVTNDAKPIWFFCKQNKPAPHCNAGMVGVINVQPGPNSLAAFVAAAQNDTLVPGPQGGNVGVGASASGDVVIPSGLSSASLFKGPTAVPTSSAPAGSGASGATSSGNPAPTQGGGATTLGFSLAAAAVGALAAAVLL
ncbi:hypothetical protein GGX14DRAFT_581568 [Mycena pura]|uniref:Extracellular serine-rich protein n=1 Tax=Mycena pura TaxID=153505 RepID=A0AAD6YUJ3_9AGAR|nr:hypothetical protein GGX14DRAFT_581568 [Mycena pura]